MDACRLFGAPGDLVGDGASALPERAEPGGAHQQHLVALVLTRSQDPLCLIVVDLDPPPNVTRLFVHGAFQGPVEDAPPDVRRIQADVGLDVETGETPFLPFRECNG